MKSPIKLSTLLLPLAAAGALAVSVAAPAGAATCDTCGPGGGGGTPTTTAVTSSLNPAVAGQQITFTATVSAGGGAPGGSVQFVVDGANAGSPALVGSGRTATYTTSALPGGDHTVVAQYSGDSSYDQSASPPFTEHVKYLSSTTLASSLNPSSLGQPVTFTATVAGGGTDTGSVMFSVNGNLVAQAPVSAGKAQYTLSDLAVGTETVRADYLGDSASAASTATVDQHVNPATTTTTLTTAADPTTVGQTVTLTAAVASSYPATATGSVQFRLNGSDYGSPVVLAAGQAQFATDALAPGTYTVDAVYGGSSSNASSTSNQITQTVAKATVTVSVASSKNPATAGDGVQFTATLQGRPATGTVQFQVDGANAGAPQPVTNDTAAFTTSSLGAGDHTIAAVYSGDTYTAPGTGSTPEHVNAAPTGGGTGGQTGGGQTGGGTGLTGSQTGASGHDGQTGTGTQGSPAPGQASQTAGGGHVGQMKAGRHAKKHRHPKHARRGRHRHGTARRSRRGH